MLFDSWAGLGRVLLVGTLAYVALVLLLRISGKRTLSKLNAFDLVVTVALGSTLATVLLSKSVALAEGVLALGLLILLQYVIAWLSVRSPRLQRVIKAEPMLLLHRGRFLEGAMRAERITREEILAAVRASGAAEPQGVAAVVLETDGSLSVIAQAATTPGMGALDTVRRLDDARA
ncbi:MAG TPA: YetF domain-containing protein [Geminicoccaceae bacterium]